MDSLDHFRRIFSSVRYQEAPIDPSLPPPRPFNLRTLRGALPESAHPASGPARDVEREAMCGPLCPPVDGSESGMATV